MTRLRMFRTTLMTALIGTGALAACSVETDPDPGSRESRTPTPEPEAEEQERENEGTWGCIWGECTDASPPADEDGDGVTAATDCDDSDPAVYPGFGGAVQEGPWGADTCCDLKDNDCNGVVDAGPEGVGDGCCNLWAPCMEAIDD